MRQTQPRRSILPKRPRCWCRIDSGFLPPRGFIAAAMDFAMMAAAQWYTELVTDFVSQCSTLREAQMMRLGELTTADETRFLRPCRSCRSRASLFRNACSNRAASAALRPFLPRRLRKPRCVLQALSALELRELAIEAPQWAVPILAGNFENEEIGEAYAVVLAKRLKRSLDDVRLLDGKLLVVKQHCNRFGNLLTRAPVDRIQHPRCLRDHEMRDPRAFGDELLSGSDLSGVIPRYEPNQDIGVNGAHAACA